MTYGAGRSLDTSRSALFAPTQRPTPQSLPHCLRAVPSWVFRFRSAWTTIYAMSWKLRLGPAVSGWQPCCVVSRPRPPTRGDELAFARLVARSALTSLPQRRDECSTRGGGGHKLMAVSGRLAQRRHARGVRYSAHLHARLRLVEDSHRWALGLHNPSAGLSLSEMSRRLAVNGD